MRVGFVVWNPFQIFHMRSIVESLSDASYVALKFHASSELDRLFGPEEPCFSDAEHRIILPEEVRTLDGKYDALVCPNPFPAMEDLSRTSCIGMQYGMAKEPYNYGAWRSLFDLNLVYGKYSAQRIEPFSPTSMVGNPRFDRWFATSSDERKTAFGTVDLDPTKATLLYVPTWGELSSLDEFLPAVEELERDYNVLLKVHHKTDSHEAERMAAVSRARLGQHFSSTDDLLPLLAASDVVISDYSGVIMDAIHVGKPVVLLQSDAESLVGSKFDLATLEYARRDEIGPVVKAPDLLQSVVGKVLTGEFDYRQANARLKRECFELEAGAGVAAADAILKHLGDRSPRPLYQVYLRDELRHARSKQRSQRLELGRRRRLEKARARLMLPPPLGAHEGGYRPLIGTVARVCGHFLAAVGRSSPAYRFYRKACALAPSPKGYYELAKCGERLGHGKSSAHAYRAAISFGRAPAGWYVDLARAHARAKRWPDAIAALELAISIDSSRPAWYLKLAKYHERGKDARSALRAYRLGVQRFPGHPELLMRLGRCAFRLGEVNEAADALRQAVELDGTKAAWFDSLGRSLELVDVGSIEAVPHVGLVRSTGDLEGAVASYRRARELDPEKVAYHFRLGAAYERMRDWESSASAYEAVVRLAPHSAGAWIRLGRVREAAVELSDAEQAYARAIDLAPEGLSGYRRAAQLSMKMSRWSDVSKMALRGADPVGDPGAAALRSHPFVAHLADLLEAPAVELSRRQVSEVLDEARGREGLLPEQWWLGLHWRLLDLGWFSCAYDVKDRLATLTVRDLGSIAQVGFGPFLLKAKALAYLGREVEAFDYLASADRLASEGVERLAIRKVWSDLRAAGGDFTGAIEFLRAHEGANSDDAERTFSELIRDRSVAIVGPAASGVDAGQEIDDFDVVIRPHFVSSSNGSAPTRDGSRTDVSYYNGAASRQLEGEIEVALRSGLLRMVVLRTASYRSGRTCIRRDGDLRFIPSEYRGTFRASQFGIQRIVFDVLRYEPARVKIFNIDFFVGPKEYRDGYKRRGADFTFRGYSHDFRSDFVLIQRLAAAGLLEGDDWVSELLTWTPEKYLEGLDRKSESSTVAR